MKNEKNYWMILCNPLKWYEGTDLYQVNNLLINLDEEFWKINGRTVFNSLKVGDKGIIKVGIDKRSNKNRYNVKTKITENTLIPGVYATFKISYNKIENNHRKQIETNLGKVESFAHIKIENNFFKNQIIEKDRAIEILGQNTFNTKSSKRITQKQYEDIILEKS